MIGRIKKKFFWELRKFQRNRWLMRAVGQAKKAGGSLNYSQPPRLDCPIRCDGAGGVWLDVTLALVLKRLQSLAMERFLFRREWRSRTFL